MLNPFTSEIKKYHNFPARLQADKCCQTAINIVDLPLDTDIIELEKKCQDCYNELLFLILSALLIPTEPKISLIAALTLLVHIDAPKTSYKLKSLLTQLNHNLTEGIFPVNRMFFYEQSKSTKFNCSCDAFDQKFSNIIKETITSIERLYPSIIKIDFSNDRTLSDDELRAYQYRLLLWCIVHYSKELYSKESFICSKIYSCISSCYLFYHLEKTKNLTWKYRYHFAGSAFEEYAKYNDVPQDGTINEATKLLMAFKSSYFAASFERPPDKTTSTDHNNLLLFVLRLKALREGFFFTTCPELLNIINNAWGNSSLENQLWHKSFMNLLKQLFHTHNHVMAGNNCAMLTQQNSIESILFCYPRPLNLALGVYHPTEKAKGTYIHKKTIKTKNLPLEQYVFGAKKFLKYTASKLPEFTPDCREFLSDKTDFIPQSSMIQASKISSVKDNIYRNSFDKPLCEIIWHNYPSISVLKDDNNSSITCNFYKPIMLPKRKLSYDDFSYVLGLENDSSLGKRTRTMAQNLRTLLENNSPKCAKQTIINAIGDKWKNFDIFLNYDSELYGRINHRKNQNIYPELSGILHQFSALNLVVIHYKKFLKHIGGHTKLFQKLKEIGANEFDRNYLKLFTKAVLSNNEKAEENHTDILSSHLWLRVPLQNILFLIGTTYKLDKEYNGLFFLKNYTRSSYNKPTDKLTKGIRLYTRIPDTPFNDKGEPNKF